MRVRGLGELSLYFEKILQSLDLGKYAVLMTRNLCSVNIGLYLGLTLNSMNSINVKGIHWSLSTYTGKNDRGKKHENWIFFNGVETLAASAICIPSHYDWKISLLLLLIEVNPVPLSETSDVSQILIKLSGGSAMWLETSHV